MRCRQEGAGKGMIKFSKDHSWPLQEERRGLGRDGQLGVRMN